MPHMVGLRLARDRSCGRPYRTAAREPWDITSHASARPSRKATVGLDQRRRLRLPVPARSRSHRAPTPEVGLRGRFEIDDFVERPRNVTGRGRRAGAAKRARSGSSITILRTTGKSLTTTGTPAARHSKSLFGEDRYRLRFLGGIGIAPTSADATHGSRSDGGTGSSRWTRPPKRGSAASCARRSPVLPGAQQHQVSAGEARIQDGVEQRVEAPRPVEDAVVEQDRLVWSEVEGVPDQRRWRVWGCPSTERSCARPAGAPPERAFGTGLQARR